MAVPITCQIGAMTGAVCTQASKGFVVGPGDNPVALWKEGAVYCDTHSKYMLKDLAGEGKWLSIADVEALVVQGDTPVPESTPAYTPLITSAPASEDSAYGVKPGAILGTFVKRDGKEVQYREVEVATTFVAEYIKRMSDRIFPTYTVEEWPTILATSAFVERFTATQPEASAEPETPEVCTEHVKVAVCEKAQALLKKAHVHRALAKEDPDLFEEMIGLALSYEKAAAKAQQVWLLQQGKGKVEVVHPHGKAWVALRQGLYLGGQDALHAFDAAIADGVLCYKGTGKGKASNGHTSSSNGTAKAPNTAKPGTEDRQDLINRAHALKRTGSSQNEIATALNLHNQQAAFHLTNRSKCTTPDCTAVGCSGK